MIMSRFKNLFVVIIFNSICIHGSKFTWFLIRLFMHNFEMETEKKSINSTKVLSKEFINHFL